MQVTPVQCYSRLMGRTYEKVNVFEWHKWFKGGCKVVEDDERSCPLRSHKTSENVEKVQNLVLLNSQPSLLWGNTDVMM
jgi:hypothetical protein